eukprot:3523721-Prorocentrum_lima.AAC.1
MHEFENEEGDQHGPEATTTTEETDTSNIEQDPIPISTTVANWGYYTLTGTIHRWWSQWSKRATGDDALRIELS